MCTREMMQVEGEEGEGAKKKSKQTQKAENHMAS